MAPISVNRLLVTAILIAACSKPQGKRTDAGVGVQTDTGVGVQTDAGADLRMDVDVDVGAGAIMVTPDHCPSEREPIGGKIYAETAYTKATPDKVWPVAVWLRANSLPAVPDCPGDSARDARCAARDAALIERQHLNVQEVTCALNVLGDRIVDAQPLWYELPYHLTSGEPVPVGLGVGLLLTGPQIVLLAAHPFVEAIQPAPGTVPGSGFGAPGAPDECPTASEDPTPKLSRLTQIQGKGRQPALIALDVSERVLPAAGDRERAILNTRQITCVKRRIDARVAEAAPNVSYNGAAGSLDVFPPFGQAAAVTTVIGRGLTWDDAVGLASHPYIAEIWTFDGLQYEPTKPGCPPDLGAPIPTVACTDQREPQEAIDGKFAAAQRAQLESATTRPIDVGIMLSGGAVICPAPACSVPPCPGLTSYEQRWTDENAASQRCVRDLITSVGGTSKPDVLWIINGFYASLTWDQIKAVAAYPQVTSIEPSSSAPPP